MTDTLRFGLMVEYVDDLNTARSFYTDVLGLRVDQEMPGFVQFVDAAGVHVGIADQGSLSDSRKPEVFWLVSDATAAFRALPDSVEVSFPLTEKPFGTVFGITDPAGEVQYVLQLAPPPVAG